MTRKILMLIPLLSGIALAACAQPPDNPDTASPAGTLAPGANASVEASDQPVPGQDEAAAAPGDASRYDGMAGLSERTTRGHVWADPFVDGDLVTIPLPVATLGDHVHFEVDSGDGVIGFIGYFMDGDFFVRADECPACGAQRIEWGGSLVVCRACGAVFDAVTGEADGAPRGYPAGTVPCVIANDAVAMSLADLVMAHTRTAAGEETLFELPTAVENEDRGDTSWPRCCRT